MKRLKNFFSWLRGKEIVCGCGHTSKMEKEVHVGDERTTFKILYKPNRIPPYCLDCVEKMTITCPWCGKPIFIGDYVTLYTPKNPDFKIPEGAVVYSENPLQLVGCQRAGCADTGADYCGIWETPGVVKRFPSAIERAMMTSDPVIMNLGKMAGYFSQLFLFEKINNLFNFGNMKESLKKILIGIGVLVLLGLVLYFLIDVKLGPGYEEQSEKEEFKSELFFDNLKVISGTIFEGPSQELYTQYGKFLDSTDKYLKLETYDFTNKFFKTRFKNLLKNKIPVQIILENNKYQEYGNTFRELQNYFSGDENIELRSDEQMGTTYVHAKITLNEDSFRVQTSNLTKSSFESNREHFFYSDDSDFHDSLEKLFDADRVGDNLSTLNLHPNLVVCPFNCREVIKTLLESAEKSIVIQTQYIVDDEILDILRKKSEQIDMAIIVADTDDNYDLILYFGPGIARTLKTHYNHTKMILVDEKYLLLGSMNLSANSLDNNREIGIILMDTGHISTFEKGFKQDWFDSI